ncbi:hypothetical protein PC128_g5076, partial [Phytophthora cactorum]
MTKGRQPFHVGRPVHRHAWATKSAILVPHLDPHSSIRLRLSKHLHLFRFRVSRMGSYLSIANNTDDPWTCKIGPDEAALKIAGIAISVVGTLATVIGTAGAAAPVASALAANGVVSV